MIKKNIDKQVVVRLLDDGWSQTSIARQLNVSRTFLCKHLKEWGISARKNIDEKVVVKLIREGINLETIAKQLGVTRTSIYNRFKKWRVSRRSITFNENFFDEINTQEKAYWLGFLMADGCVSMTHNPKVVIALAYKDKEHLLKWHTSINSSLKLYDRKDGAYQSQHCSIKMCNDLIKHGCVPRKSLKLEFPYLPKELLNHFVRGYFDGDGCATISNKKQLRISFMGTEMFLRGLSRILNVSNKLRFAGNNKVTRVLEIHGNKKAGNIVKWMYDNAIIFLERKKEVCHSYL